MGDPHNSGELPLGVNDDFDKKWAEERFKTGAHNQKLLRGVTQSFYDCLVYGNDATNGGRRFSCCFRVLVYFAIYTLVLYNNILTDYWLRHFNPLHFTGRHAVN